MYIQKNDKRYNRVLSLKDLVFLGLSMTIGAGIFVLIDDVAKYSKNFMWLAMIFAGIMSLLTAFSYGELAGIFKNNMGEAEYIRSVSNDTISHIMGIIILISDIFIISTVALGLGNYVSKSTGFNAESVAIFSILLLNYFNYRGIKLSTTLSRYGLYIKLGALLTIILAAFITNKPKENLFNKANMNMSGLTTASIIALFAYLGFNNITNFTEETIDPEINIGKAITYTVSIVTVIYTSLIIACLFLMTSKNISDSVTPLASVAQKLFGSYGFIFISILAIISIMDTLLVSSVSESRYMHSLFSNINNDFGKHDMDSTYQTPYLSIILLSVLSIMAILFFKHIGITALYGDILILTVFVIVNAIAIILRYKYPDITRKFKIPFNIGKIPIPAVLGIIFGMVALYQYITHIKK